MTMSDRIGGVLRRRPALLAACALPPIILLVAYMQSTRGLEQQARELQRENLALRLSQLASAVDRESAELGSAAQLLAQSDSIVELVQENRFDSRSSALGAALPTVDALVVATAVGAVRLSGAVLDGRLTERAPDPAVAQYLNALLAGRATSASPSDREPPAALINDQLVSTRRIFARGSSVPVGWLIATRNLNRAMLARLESSVGGALIARPIAKLDRGTVPAEVRTWLGGRLGEASGLSTKVLPDGSAFAALRDESGHAAWVFQVRAATAVGAPASDASFAQALPANGALAPALAGFVALLAALVAASVVIVLKRYYGHRLSVDSRYKAIIDQANDGIVIVDAKRQEIQYCNPAFLARIGYTQRRSSGIDPDRHFRRCDRDRGEACSRAWSTPTRRWPSICSSAARTERLSTPRCAATPRCRWPRSACLCHARCLAAQQGRAAAHRESAAPRRDGAPRSADRAAESPLPDGFLPQAIDEAKAAHACSASCSSISIASSTSTTRAATRPATSCCRKWPARCGPASAIPMW